MFLSGRALKRPTTGSRPWVRLLVVPQESIYGAFGLPLRQLGFNVTQF